MGDVVDFPTNEIEDNSLDRNFKFFPHALLLSAAQTAKSRGYNRQFSKKFLKILKNSDSDFNYPVVFALQHEHAAGIKIDPHVRCQIAGPWGEKGAIKEVCLDVDIDLFSILPDTSIFDDETGHIPQA